MIKSLIIFLYIFFAVLSISCSKTKNLNSIVQESRSCHIPTDSLIGKSYLTEEYLSRIKAITPNPQNIKNKEGMILIKGGVFEMGGDVPAGFENMTATALPQPDEYPKHPVRISDFYIDEHEVTVADYLKFVESTNYKTVAEYDMDWDEMKKQLPAGTPQPDPEDLKASSLVFHYLSKQKSADNMASWWAFIKGANWKNPDGTNPDINSILNQPVTQVSWYDAMAYAKWVGKRLPTEAEFEYAMRAGMKNNMYPWGNEKIKDTKNKGNFLQGKFPYSNSKEDGFETIAPIKSFPPNAYGLYDIAGNVWEWTNDWYSATYYEEVKKMGIITNPKGPDKTGEVYNPTATNKVVRGGSFLCEDQWCSGYRNSRRMRLSPDTGMQHIGFRLVKDII